MDETTTPTVARLEQELRAVAADLVDPREGECLLCFVARAVDELGCDDTLRWARRYRDLRVPAATGLERRLQQVGGYCDCEILLNGYHLVRALWERDVHTDALHEPAVSPPCAEVRAGSARPCANWQRGTWW